MAHSLYDDPKYDAALALIGMSGRFPGANSVEQLWENITGGLRSIHLFTDLASLGNDKDSLAPRISYKLNLKGPSVTVQTYCSTSLVAVHLACQSLINYECDMAMAGGAAISIPQERGYVYEEGGIPEAVDPLRLLTQLEHLQKALWWHAVSPEATSVGQMPDSTLRFSAESVSEEKLPIDGLPHTPPSLLKQERKRRYQKSGRPHDWRTREDPFENVWNEVTSWLEARPELTAAEIFRELQRRYPERWRPTQARTLRRGVQKLRERLLVTFDDGWGEEVITGQSPTPALHAEVMVTMGS